MSIRRDIERALGHYGKYKRNEPISAKHYGILEILREVEAVETYVDAKKQEGTRLEHEALKMFLEGGDMHEITMSERFSSLGFERDIVFSWIHGNGERWGLINTMLEVYSKQIQDYCPFCEDRVFDCNKPIAIYPLHGRICPNCQKEV